MDNRKLVPTSLSTTLALGLSFLFTISCYSQIVHLKDIPDGYHGTIWGTPEKVFSKDHPEMTPVFTNPVGDKKNIIALFDPNNSSNAIFYYFVDGELEGVSENPQVQSDFLSAAQSVMEQYSQPTKRDSASFMDGGHEYDSHTALWNGKKTDIEVTFIEGTETSQKLVASISYFQPNARATTNFALANMFYLHYNMRVSMPEFGKGYDGLDWGADQKTVSALYPTMKMVSRVGSLTVYESLASTIPYSIEFLFSDDQLVAVTVALTHEQADEVYGGRSALVKQLSSIYGGPIQEPSYYHAPLKGSELEWFWERFDLQGNANTQVVIEFGRPLQTPDPGNDAFRLVQIIFFSSGVVTGM